MSLVYAADFAPLESAATEMLVISAWVKSLNDELAQGTLRAVLDLDSVAKDVFDQRKAEWDEATGDMSVQADEANRALDEILRLYGSGGRLGTQLWAW